MKKTIIFHTYRTLYVDNMKRPGCKYVVAIDGYLYRIRRSFCGIPLPSKYEENVTVRICNYKGGVVEPAKTDFYAEDQEAVGKVIEDVKNTLAQKRKEYKKKQRLWKIY